MKNKLVYFDIDKKGWAPEDVRNFFQTLKTVSKFSNFIPQTIV